MIYRRYILLGSAGLAFVSFAFSSYFYFVICDAFWSSIFLGVFGSAFCLLLTSAFEYLTSQKRAYSEYFDFVARFRKSMRQKDPLSLDNNRIVYFYTSFDADDFLLQNQRLFSNLNTKNKNIGIIYRTIEQMSRAIANIKYLDFNGKREIIDKDIKLFNAILFSAKGDLVKSWLDDDVFVTSLKVLANKAGLSNCISVGQTYLCYINEEVVAKGQNYKPWDFPPDKSVDC